MQLLEIMISDLQRASAPSYACGALRALLASAREMPGELFNDSAAFERLFTQAVLTEREVVRSLALRATWEYEEQAAHARSSTAARRASRLSITLPSAVSALPARSGELDLAAAMRSCAELCASKQVRPRTISPALA